MRLWGVLSSPRFLPPTPLALRFLRPTPPPGPPCGGPGGRGGAGEAGRKILGRGGPAGHTRACQRCRLVNQAASRFATHPPCCPAHALHCCPVPHHCPRVNHPTVAAARARAITTHEKTTVVRSPAAARPVGSRARRGGGRSGRAAMEHGSGPGTSFQVPPGLLAPPPRACPLGSSPEGSRRRGGGTGQCRGAHYMLPGPPYCPPPTLSGLCWAGQRWG